MNLQSQILQSVQVDKVKIGANDSNWFRDLLSEFAQLRLHAATKAKEESPYILPVVITSSTSAVNASFHETASCNAMVHSIRMRPLKNEELEHIVADLCQRLRVQDGPDVSSFPAIIKPLLPWLSGTPRLLSWLLCSLSGRAWTNFKDQAPAVGEYTVRLLLVLLLSVFLLQILIYLCSCTIVLDLQVLILFSHSSCLLRWKLIDNFS